MPNTSITPLEGSSLNDLRETVLRLKDRSRVLDATTLSYLFMELDNYFYHNTSFEEASLEEKEIYSELFALRDVFPKFTARILCYQAYSLIKTSPHEALTLLQEVATLVPNTPDYRLSGWIGVIAVCLGAPEIACAYFRSVCLHYGGKIEHTYGGSFIAHHYKRALDMLLSFYATPETATSSIETAHTLLYYLDHLETLCSFAEDTLNTPAFLPRVMALYSTVYTHIVNSQEPLMTWIERRYAAASPLVKALSPLTQHDVTQQNDNSLQNVPAATPSLYKNFPEKFVLYTAICAKKSDAGYGIALKGFAYALSKENILSNQTPQHHFITLKEQKELVKSLIVMRYVSSLERVHKVDSLVNYFGSFALHLWPSMLLNDVASYLITHQKFHEAEQCIAAFSNHINLDPLASLGEHILLAKLRSQLALQKGEVKAAFDSAMEASLCFPLSDALSPLLLTKLAFTLSSEESEMPAYADILIAGVQENNITGKQLKETYQLLCLTHRNAINTPAKIFELGQIAEKIGLWLDAIYLYQMAYNATTAHDISVRTSLVPALARTLTAFITHSTKAFATYDTVYKHFQTLRALYHGAKEKEIQDTLLPHMLEAHLALIEHNLSHTVVSYTSLKELLLSAFTATSRNTVQVNALDKGLLRLFGELLEQQRHMEAISFAEQVHAICKHTLQGHYDERWKYREGLAWIEGLAKGGISPILLASVWKDFSALLKKVSATKDATAFISMCRRYEQNSNFSGFYKRIHASFPPSAQTAPILAPHELCFNDLYIRLNNAHAKGSFPATTAYAKQVWGKEKEAALLSPPEQTTLYSILFFQAVINWQPEEAKAALEKLSALTSKEAAWHYLESAALWLLDRNHMEAYDTLRTLFEAYITLASLPSFTPLENLKKVIDSYREKKPAPSLEVIGSAQLPSVEPKPLYLYAGQLCIAVQDFIRQQTYFPPRSALHDASDIRPPSYLLPSLPATPFSTALLLLKHMEGNSALIQQDIQCYERQILQAAARVPFISNEDAPLLLSVMLYRFSLNEQKPPAPFLVEAYEKLISHFIRLDSAASLLQAALCAHKGNSADAFAHATAYLTSILSCDIPELLCRNYEFSFLQTFILKLSTPRTLPLPSDVENGAVSYFSALFSLHKYHQNSVTDALRASGLRAIEAWAKAGLEQKQGKAVADAFLQILTNIASNPKACSALQLWIGILILTPTTVVHSQSIFSTAIRADIEYFFNYYNELALTASQIIEKSRIVIFSSFATSEPTAELLKKYVTTLRSHGQEQRVIEIYRLLVPNVPSERLQSLFGPKVLSAIQASASPKLSPAIQKLSSCLLALTMPFRVQITGDAASVRVTVAIDEKKAPALRDTFTGLGFTVQSVTTNNGSATFTFNSATVPSLSPEVMQSFPYMLFKEGIELPVKSEATHQGSILSFIKDHTKALSDGHNLAHVSTETLKKWVPLLEQLIEMREELSAFNEETADTTKREIERVLSEYMVAAYGALLSSSEKDMAAPLTRKILPLLPKNHPYGLLIHAVQDAKVGAPQLLDTFQKALAAQTSLNKSVIAIVQFLTNTTYAQHHTLTEKGKILELWHQFLSRLEAPLFTEVPSLKNDTLTLLSDYLEYLPVENDCIATLYHATHAHMLLTLLPQTEATMRIHMQVKKMLFMGYFRTRQWQLCVDHYAESFKGERVAYYYGFALAHLERHKEAAVILETWLATHASDHETRLLLVKSYLALSLIDKAEETLACFHNAIPEGYEEKYLALSIQLSMEKQHFLPTPPAYAEPVNFDTQHAAYLARIDEALTHGDKDVLFTLCMEAARLFPTEERFAPLKIVVVPFRATHVNAATNLVLLWLQQSNAHTDLKKLEEAYKNFCLCHANDITTSEHFYFLGQIAEKLGLFLDSVHLYIEAAKRTKEKSLQYQFTSKTTHAAMQAITCSTQQVIIDNNSLINACEQALHLLELGTLRPSKTQEWRRLVLLKLIDTTLSSSIWDHTKLSGWLKMCVESEGALTDSLQKELFNRFLHLMRQGRYLDAVNFAVHMQYVPKTLENAWKLLEGSAWMKAFVQGYATDKELAKSIEGCIKILKQVTPSLEKNFYLETLAVNEPLLQKSFPVFTPELPKKVASSFMLQDIELARLLMEQQLKGAYSEAGHFARALWKVHNWMKLDLPNKAFLYQTMFTHAWSNFQTERAISILIFLNEDKSLEGKTALLQKLIGEAVQDLAQRAHFAAYETVFSLLEHYQLFLKLDYKSLFHHCPTLTEALRTQHPKNAGEILSLMRQSLSTGADPWLNAQCAHVLSQIASQLTHSQNVLSSYDHLEQLTRYASTPISPLALKDRDLYKHLFYTHNFKYFDLFYARQLHQLHQDHAFLPLKELRLVLACMLHAHNASKDHATLSKEALRELITHLHKFDAFTQLIDANVTANTTSLTKQERFTAVATMLCNLLASLALHPVPLLLEEYRFLYQFFDKYLNKAEYSEAEKLLLNDYLALYFCLPETVVSLIGIEDHKQGNAVYAEARIQMHIPKYLSNPFSSPSLESELGFYFYLLFKAENYSQILTLYKRIENHVSALSDLPLIAAKALFAEQNTLEAVALLEAYLRMHPHSKEALLLSADCHIRSGHLDNALALLHRLPASGLTLEEQYGRDTLIATISAKADFSAEPSLTLAHTLQNLFRYTVYGGPSISYDKTQVSLFLKTASSVEELVRYLRKVGFHVEACFNEEKQSFQLSFATSGKTTLTYEEKNAFCIKLYVKQFPYLTLTSTSPSLEYEVKESAKNRIEKMTQDLSVYRKSFQQLLSSFSEQTAPAATALQEAFLVWSTPMLIHCNQLINNQNKFKTLHRDFLENAFLMLRLVHLMGMDDARYRPLIQGLLAVAPPKPDQGLHQKLYAYLLHAWDLEWQKKSPYEALELVVKAIDIKSLTALQASNILKELEQLLLHSTSTSLKDLEACFSLIHSTRMRHETLKGFIEDKQYRALLMRYVHAVNETEKSEASSHTTAISLMEAWVATHTGDQDIQLLLENQKARLQPKAPEPVAPEMVEAKEQPLPQAEKPEPAALQAPKKQDTTQALGVAYTWKKTQPTTTSRQYSWVQRVRELPVPVPVAPPEPVAPVSNTNDASNEMSDIKQLLTLPSYDEMVVYKTPSYYQPFPPTPRPAAQRATPPLQENKGPFQECAEKEMEAIRGLGKTGIEPLMVLCIQHGFSNINQIFSTLYNIWDNLSSKGKREAQAVTHIKKYWPELQAFKHSYAPDWNVPLPSAEVIKKCKQAQRDIHFFHLPKEGVDAVEKALLDGENLTQKSPKKEDSKQKTLTQKITQERVSPPVSPSRSLWGIQ